MLLFLKKTALRFKSAPLLLLISSLAPLSSSAIEWGPLTYPPPPSFVSLIPNEEHPERKEATQSSVGGSLVASPLEEVEPPFDGQTLEPDYRLYKERALRATLGYIESLLLTQYAPIRWKAKHWNWNPEEEVAIAQQKLSALDQPRLDLLKPIFNRLFDSAHDVHTSIFYKDHRVAIVPILVKWIDEQAFVRFSEVPGVQVGDLIEQFDGVDLLDYASALFYGEQGREMPPAHPALNMQRLFIRSGALDALPHTHAPAVLTVRRGKKVFQVCATWQTAGSWSKSSTSKKRTPSS